MGKKQQKTGEPTVAPAEPFDALVHNAIDFVEMSIRDLTARPKYSVIHFASAVELFFKARLFREHWSLIVLRPETAVWTQMQSGNFRSVSLDESVDRLEKIATEKFGKAELRSFTEVRDHRNKLVHFFNPDYAQATSRATVAKIVAEQCRAWMYLHRLLISRWKKHFEAHTAAIARVDRAIHQRRVFLREKYATLKDQLAADVRQGGTIVRCRSCGFKSTKVKEERDLLYDATCVVCGEGGECLYIECNACEKKLLVFEQGDGKCSCGFEAGLEWLVDTLGPATDPKEDSEVAYCSECEYTGTPTAIPLDDGERYFCVSCFTSHADAERCGWCNELVTGIDSTDSYLSGCVMCEGRLGHDTD